MSQSFHVQAHRGASLEKKENTLESVVCAALMGVNSIEVDLQLTSDSIPVLFHDFSVSPENTLNQSRSCLLSDLSFEALMKIEWKDKRLEVPTLESIFKKLKTLNLKEFQWLDIELKVQPGISDVMRKKLIVEKTLSVVQEHWDLKQTAFRSFDWEVLKRVKEQSPQARIIPLLDTHEKNYQKALELRTEWIAPCISTLDKENLTLAHQAGVKVMPYTVNEPERWSELLHWGVDGVTTDNPRALLDLLKKKT